MFNRCNRRELTGFFRLLKGSSCPLCVIVEARTGELLQSAAQSNQLETLPLCDRHLKLLLERFDEPRALASALRRTMLAALKPGTEESGTCPVCKFLEQTTNSIVRALERSDAKQRFRRSIEGGPLFCRRHYELVNQNSAPHFVRTQRLKLKRLANDLARIEGSPAAVYSDGSIVETLVFLLSDLPECSGRLETILNRKDSTESHRKAG